MNRITALFFLMVFSACGPDEGGESGVDNFNRKVMLENWADNIIVPAYVNFVSKMDDLDLAATSFVASPDEAGLTTLRQAWLDAYIAWQSVDMFEIGKAEELTLRNYINVFPLDSEGMMSSLLAGNYDLTSINRQDEQGFSALDFLLYGLATTDAEIIAFYSDPTDGEKYNTYLMDVAKRMQMLSKQVLNDWQNGYRDIFVSRDGSSGSESVNTMVNNYMFYYERFLRAGKIGIPAGVFSGSPLDDRIEARFRGDVSKTLFMVALTASQDFFNGHHFNSSEIGLGLNGYLDELNTLKGSEKLSSLINAQFDATRDQANQLSADLGEQINTDNTKMTETYDELQKNVILLKVDMLQALNIKIDFVDADGD